MTRVRIMNYLVKRNSMSEQIHMQPIIFEMEKQLHTTNFAIIRVAYILIMKSLPVIINDKFDHRHDLPI